ncbi:4-hydroxy-3-methylbut-2-enyl diphosphate reductase IspH [Peptoclostridium acidaminophilum DSM 3953]|uniref:4-hydroxy-3-methylbut-2-enyl diphosphate reductase n=1 Tax=Peptoclostridium acidaminophilum DSM 3953 TaxID=1286171 RepID=W8U711_PEPAC|nr:4-hydroxy-3-methylbut-2-enyl diphosphate reductase [Peptoclostridium acidaminophilum]AHM56671.1 4-hydroxy-3-methylbut-2-enyl diphosphate reductase IspH [Peptoclostridium acidaminophilum DSM 3953]
MKIEIAEFAGFCFGVKRAMDMAWKKLQDSQGNTIYSLGPLIHNNQAVERYQQQGLKIADSVDEVEEGSVVIIRSHGVALSVYDELMSRNVEIIDATCPFVSKIQKIVSKDYAKGKAIIIVGDPLHPEVIGINGWCGNNASIIKELEDVDNMELDSTKEYCIVVQTTMNSDGYASIQKKLEEKLPSAVFNNTICSATCERQEASRKLSEKVELIIVIGGLHSSNTRKLAQVCSANCRTMHIETKDDLDIEEICGYSTIGITAGASTPDWIIEETVEYIKGAHKNRR